MEKNKKVGFITFEKASNRDEGSIGSTRIRARWVAKYWEDAEEWKIGEQYDVLIFQKVYWDEMMDNFRGIKILDMCDPDWLEGRDIMKYVDKCDAVTTSTQALADYVQSFAPKKIVRCIPDRIDFEEHKTIKESQGENIKSAVWFGYSHNIKYIQKTFNELIKRGIQLHVYTDTNIQLDYDHQALKLERHSYNYDTIHQELIKYDVALMPERSNDFKGKFKSNNKITTCWALKVPVIEVPEDFDRLATKEARDKEVQEKYNIVQGEYNVIKSVDEYKLLISELLNARSKSNNRL